MEQDPVDLSEKKYGFDESRMRTYDLDLKTVTPPRQLDIIFSSSKKRIFVVRDSGRIRVMVMVMKTNKTNVDT
jgi:hypothetical protein